MQSDGTIRESGVPQTTNTFSRLLSCPECEDAGGELLSAGRWLIVTAG
jgi:hypothetical protein